MVGNAPAGAGVKALGPDYPGGDPQSARCGSLSWDHRQRLPPDVLAFDDVLERIGPPAAAGVLIDALVPFRDLDVLVVQLRVLRQPENAVLVAD
jgi:hypothetical protein